MLHSGRMVLQLAGPGGRMGRNRVVEHLLGSMEPSNVITLCGPFNFEVWGQVYRREICGLLTRVVRRMEFCVRMLDSLCFHHIS